MTKTKIEWTPERVQELERLWKSGIGTKEIANVLGTTKNSVIAKAHRLGLGHLRKQANGSGEKIKSYDARSQYKTTHSVPLKVAKHKAYGSPKKMDDLGPKDCRWPIGDPRDPEFHFCGAETEKYPYCAAHCRVAFRGR